MSKVNPHILRWARESAGLTLEQAAEKIGLNDTVAQSASQRLVSLEDGSEEPSRPLLLRMSKQYRRPLVTFYMVAPPRTGEHGQDFRTLSETSSPTEEAWLDTLRRRIQGRHSMVKAMLEAEDEAEPKPFVASRIGVEDALVLARSLKGILNVDLPDYRAARDPSQAFDCLRAGAERAGVFVLLASNLGNYHTTMSTNVFRGFAIADPVAPFVVINDQDSHSAWSFTLLHELTHILLGQSGVSGDVGDTRVEQLCDDAASEFLLPRDELLGLNLAAFSDVAAAQTKIEEIAAPRKVSRSLVAYRLHREGLLSASMFKELRSLYRAYWRKAQKDKKDKAAEKESGPNFYVVRGHRLGKALIDLVERMVDSQALSTSKAGLLLNVTASQVQALLQQSSSRARRSSL